MTNDSSKKFMQNFLSRKEKIDSMRVQRKRQEEEARKKNIQLK